MIFEQNNIALQDTTQKVSLPKNDASIQIERQNISLGEIREIKIDTTRLSTPKPIPIIKVKPFIEVTDTANYPAFNVLTGKFELNGQQITNQFSTNIIEPAQNILNQNNNISQTNQKKHIIAKPKKQTNLYQTYISKKAKIKTGSKSGFTQTDSMLIIIILLLIFFIWIKIGYNRFIKAVSQAIFNRFAASRLTSEANVTRSRVFRFMDIFFFLTTSLFIYQWINYNKISIYGHNNIIRYFFILAILIILLVSKSVVIKIIDVIFLHKGRLSEYNNCFYLYCKMLAFILLPIVSILPFVSLKIVPWLFTIGFCLIALTYILILFRGIIIGIKNRLSILYLILYLCALEILPVLVLYQLYQLYM